MVLKFETKLFEPADEHTFNVYTEYRRGLPRFRFINSATAYVVLFPDGPSKPGSTVGNIIPRSLHQSSSEYSSELLDLIPEDRISSLPLPFLGPLLSDYCQKYLMSKDDMAAIAVEGLVDGMDLDDAWCARNLTNLEPRGQQYVSSVIRRKAARMDDFSPNTITCIIANDGERERLLKVPGREIPSCLDNKSLPHVINDLWNRTAEICYYYCVNIPHRFLESQKHNLPHTV